MNLSPPRTWLSTPLSLVCCIAFALLGLVTGAPASAAAPQLSIAIDDGQSQVQGGDTRRYTLTVTNLGGTIVKDLHVSQTVPFGTRLHSADHHAKYDKGALRWSFDLAAGESATVGSALTVNPSPPASLLGLATVACATASSDAAPTVCATDSNLLPAGFDAERQQSQLGQMNHLSRSPTKLPLIVAGSGALLALVLGLTLLVSCRGRTKVRRSLASGSSPTWREPRDL